MAKTFSPQIEQALDQATEAPLLMTTDGRPSIVALTTDLFEIVVMAANVDPATCNPKVITRAGKPEITLVLEEDFNPLRDAFNAATATRGSTPAQAASTGR